MSSTDAVRDHYDVYPYPTVVNVAVPQPPEHKRRRLDYLLRRRRGEGLPEDARIWVAGCGTQQAVHWALAFPEGRVLATDLSSRVLERASALAGELGLSNLRFERHDLMRPCPEGDFDLIVSTGVVHHLPDPTTGLGHLRQALAEGGAIQLMVYSRVHRAPVAAVRRAGALLRSPTDGDEDRYALSGRLVDAMLRSSRCEPLGAEALELARDHRDRDRSFVADALLHPLEHSYDVDGLLGLLDGAGLSLTSWMQPSLWRLEEYLDDRDLLSRFERLGPVQRWKLIYDVAGLSSPLFELLAEPRERPHPAPWSRKELSRRPLQRCTGARVIAVQDGKPVKTAQVPAYDRQGDELVGRPGAGYGSPRVWRLPAHGEKLLLDCDGTHTLEDLVAEHGDEFGEEAIATLVGMMLPDDLGLVVPAGPPR